MACVSATTSNTTVLLELATVDALPHCPLKTVVAKSWPGWGPDQGQGFLGIAQHDEPQKL